MESVANEAAKVVSGTSGSHTHSSGKKVSEERPGMDLESLGPRDDCFVFEAYPMVRKLFIRRVYAILVGQLLLTSLIVFCVRAYTDNSREVLAENEGLLGTLLWPSIIGIFLSLFGLHAVAKKYPTNLILLGVFTVCESNLLAVGLVGISTELLLQAVLTTATVFIGLVLYTLESKQDFSFLGAFLFSALWIMIFGSFLQWIWPFPSWMEVAYAWGGALLYCGFIIFDTWRLHFVLRADEYIFAAINLYLDILNLFMYVLRILASRKD